MGGPKPHRILFNCEWRGGKIYRVLMDKTLGILRH
jgi:hypothetical protein